MGLLVESSIGAFGLGLCSAMPNQRFSSSGIDDEAHSWFLAPHTNQKLFCAQLRIGPRFIFVLGRVEWCRDSDMATTSHMLQYVLRLPHGAVTMQGVTQGSPREGHPLAGKAAVSCWSSPSRPQQTPSSVHRDAADHCSHGQGGKAEDQHTRPRQLSIVPSHACALKIIGPMSFKRAARGPWNELALA